MAQEAASWRQHHAPRILARHSAQFLREPKHCNLCESWWCDDDRTFYESHQACFICFHCVYAIHTLGRDVIVPAWRKLEGLEKGPLCIVCDAPESHTLTPELAAFLRDSDVCMHYLPHHTSHYLQPLDLGWNKAWRKAFRAIVDALITCAQNSHAYMDDKLCARFYA